MMGINIVHGNTFHRLAIRNQKYVIPYSQLLETLYYLRFSIIRKVPETKPNVQFPDTFCRVSADEVIDKKGLKRATIR